MAGTGNLQIVANATNLATGSETFGPFTTVVSSAVVYAQNVSVSTNTAISLPTGLTCLVIVGPNGVYPAPNPSYGGTLTLKGVSGDTGINISAKYPTVLEWDTTTTSPSSIVINATVATTVNLWGM